jgi:hypothetical protein
VKPKVITLSLQAILVSQQIIVPLQKFTNQNFRKIEPKKKKKNKKANSGETLKISH